MTLHDIQRATSTYDCSVFGCTGTATSQGGLCEWHRRNGRPEDIRTPGAQRAYLGDTMRKKQEAHQRRLDRLEERIAGLNRTINQARAERDRLQDELDQARGRAA